MPKRKVYFPRSKKGETLNKEILKLNTLLKNLNFQNNQNYVLGKLSKSKVLGKYYTYKFDIFVVKIAYFLIHLIGALVCGIFIPTIIFLFSDPTLTNINYIVYSLLGIVLGIILFRIKDFRDIYITIGISIVFIGYVIFLIWLFNGVLGFDNVRTVITVIILIVLGLAIGVYDTIILILRVFLYFPSYLVLRIYWILFLDKIDVFYIKRDFTGENITNLNHKKYIKANKKDRKQLIRLLLLFCILLLVFWLLYLLSITNDAGAQVFFLGFFIFTIFMLPSFFKVLQELSFVETFINFLISFDVSSLFKLNEVKRIGKFYVIDKYLMKNK